MYKKQLDVAKALYGDEQLGVFLTGTTKLPKKINTTPTEEHEQILLATWLDRKNILHFAIPNGASRSKKLIKGRWVSIEGAKLKRGGVKKGVPDICVPLARKSYHGLFLELKRQKGGVLSDEQQYWIETLNREGYLAKVAHGFENAKEIICNYLGI